MDSSDRCACGSSDEMPSIGKPHASLTAPGGAPARGGIAQRQHVSSTSTLPTTTCASWAAAKRRHRTINISATCRRAPGQSGGIWPGGACVPSTLPTSCES
eukprot:576399-Prymnesium_polylepis.1